MQSPETLEIITNSAIIALSQVSACVCEEMGQMLIVSLARILRVRPLTGSGNEPSPMEGIFPSGREALQISECDLLFLAYHPNSRSLVDS